MGIIISGSIIEDAERQVVGRMKLAGDAVADLIYQLGEVDVDALDRYIAHHSATLRLSLRQRGTELSETSDIPPIATLMRHCFVVGTIAGRKAADAS